jgi:hypothetical protein
MPRAGAGNYSLLFCIGSGAIHDGDIHGLRYIGGQDAFMFAINVGQVCNELRPRVEFSRGHVVRNIESAVGVTDQHFASTVYRNCPPACGARLAVTTFSNLY